MKAAFGIDSAPPESRARRTERPAAPPRSENLAAETQTKFERPARPAGPTLAERIRSAAPAARATAPAVVPPHLVGSRTGPPPADPAARADGSAGSHTTAGGASSSTQSRARARVLDAGTSQVLGTVDTLLGSGGEAAAAAANVQLGLDYFAGTFGRDGVDGAGAGVDVLINDRSTDEHGHERHAGNGGYYATPGNDGSTTEAIHFGVGKSYTAARGAVEQASMLHADDLAIHELTHGIIRKETGHLGGEADEAGATNEAVADVMAATATRDWRMGEGMYTARSDYRVMRNIANPNDPTAIHGLWTSMDEVRSRQAAGEEVEEHWASGVISTAAYRTQSRLGGEAGWQAVERVFYDTIDNARMGDMSFNAVAAGLRASAAAVYGEGSPQARVLDEELRRGGL